MTSECFDSHFQNISQIYKPFSPDCYIFCACSIDTHIGHGQRHMVIMPYMAIMPYYDQIWQNCHGHMVINVINMGVYGTSTKKLAVW